MFQRVAAEAVSVDPVSDGRQPLNTFVPRYPEKARRERLEGSVTVCFTITAGGFVERAKIRKSTHRWFKKPVLTAIRSSSYAPLGPGKRPSRVKSCRTFHFTLQPIKPAGEKLRQ